MPTKSLTSGVILAWELQEIHKIEGNLPKGVSMGNIVVKKRVRYITTHFLMKWNFGWLFNGVAFCSQKDGFFIQWLKSEIAIRGLDTEEVLWCIKSFHNKIHDIFLQNGGGNGKRSNSLAVSIVNEHVPKVIDEILSQILHS